MFQQNFLSWTGRWTTAPLAIPQIMLFLALLFLPQARIEGKKLIRQVAPRIPSLKRAVVRHGRSSSSSWRSSDSCSSAPTCARSRSRSLTMLIMVSLVPLDRLVEADLAGPDHLRRCRRVRVPAVGTRSRHHRWSRHRVAVRDPVRGRDGAARAPPAGPLPRAGVDGVRADGGHPLLPATRDPRVRRQADPVAPASSASTSASRSTSSASTSSRTSARCSSSPSSLGVVGVLVVWLHKSAFGRRLDRAGRQPGCVRDARRQPDRHQARRVRDLGRHRRLRRCAARRVPGHRHGAGLRDARGSRLPAAPRGRRCRRRERRGARWHAPHACSPGCRPCSRPGRGSTTLGSGSSASAPVSPASASAASRRASSRRWARTSARRTRAQAGRTRRHRRGDAAGRRTHRRRRSRPKGCRRPHRSASPGA